jgi:hypothetical protein
MVPIKPCVTLVVTLVKYQGYDQPEHKAKISHELIGGAAAYEV